MGPATDGKSSPKTRKNKNQKYTTLQNPAISLVSSNRTEITCFLRHLRVHRGLFAVTHQEIMQRHLSVAAQVKNCSGGRMTAVSCHIADVTDSRFVLGLKHDIVAHFVILCIAGFMMNKQLTKSTHYVIMSHIVLRRLCAIWKRQLA